MDVDDSHHRRELKRWIRSQFEMAANGQNSNDEVCNVQ